jgi:peptide/nickel transport system substrate-binding protein
MFARNRRWLILITLALGATLLLAACGAPATTAPQPAATTAAGAPTAAAAPTAAQPAATAVPAAAKVLHMARNNEPFSPFIPWQIDDNACLFISVNVYDSLLRTSKDGFNVEPALADKWETSTDGLTWTFHLHPGVKFSDGAAMKASDVKASLDMARGGTKSAWTDSYKAIKDITAVDDATVKMTLSQPHAPLLSELAMFPAAVLPADLATASDAKDFDNAKAWVTRGTGAYMVNGWSKGNVLVLKRNPNYWKSTPAVNEVDIEYIPDDNSRILKLQGGQTDIIDFVPLSQIAALGAQPNIKAQAFPIQQFFNVILNTTLKPLDDVKVRQALNYATDKDAIIKTVFFGQATFMNSPIPPGTYWDKTLPGYPFDVAKAQQLIKSSSYPNGATVDIQIASGNTVNSNTATILKDEWSKIGITLNIVQLETSVVRTNYRAGTVPIVISGWTNDMNDPTEIVNYEMRGGASPFAYWTRYNDPAINAKITAADLEQDPAKRGALYAELQKTWLDAAPFVFLVYNPAPAAWRSNVSGFFIDGLSYYRFEDVKLN